MDPSIGQVGQIEGHSPVWVGRATSSGTLLASLPPTVLCVCQDPAAVPAHPRLGGHCWDTPGLLLLPQGLGGAGGVKEEPLIWGLPTLAGMRADLSSGLGSVLHCPATLRGAGVVVLGSPNQGCVARVFYQPWTSMVWDQALPSATL